jgi:shikimate kinase
VDFGNGVARQGDRRPLADHPQARVALRDLVARRDPLYARASLTIDTAGDGVDRVVARLLAQIKAS